jgi:CheY-like chemotaxis protein
VSSAPPPQPHRGPSSTIPFRGVSDIGMPELDGYGLLRAVRALAAKDGGATPAVALTAFSRPADHQRAMEAGYLEHFAKPVNASALVVAVARALGRCR